MEKYSKLERGWSKEKWIMRCKSAAGLPYGFPVLLGVVFLVATSIKILLIPA